MSGDDESITLQRDVIGALVPSGQRVELPEGTDVRITQALGGSFTVVAQGHMFRIEGKDADALGKSVPDAPTLAEEASEADIEKAVWDQLRTCYDPEIPIDVVELGLIYSCHLSRLDTGYRVDIEMTLTAPGCGMGDYLVADVRSKVMSLPVVSEVEVNLTFDPPWTRDMMSEAAQLALGVF